jgi:CTP:molybdopterin cytidylyltransferase MocA
VFRELLDASSNDGARAIVRADAARVAIADVDDPGVLEDVNTPADHEAIVRRIGAAPT